MNHEGWSKQFSIHSLTIVAVLLHCFTAQADCCSNPLSAAAIGTEVASEYQLLLGDHVSRPLNPVDCFSGEAQFVASVQGRTFLAPCRFITQTAEHLKKILASEDAKKPFAPSVDHVHLAVTAEIWDEKYRHMHRDEILPILLCDPSLVAIYHSARHAPIADRKNAGTTKPTFAGFYDGRSIQQLPSRKAGADPTQAQYYRTFAWFYISVNESGELVHTAKGKAAAIEIFFDDDPTEAPVLDIVNVSSKAE